MTRRRPMAEDQVRWPMELRVIASQFPGRRSFISSWIFLLKARQSIGTFRMALPMRTRVLVLAAPASAWMIKLSSVVLAASRMSCCSAVGVNVMLTSKENWEYCDDVEGVRDAE